MFKALIESLFIKLGFIPFADHEAALERHRKFFQYTADQETQRWGRIAELLCDNLDSFIKERRNAETLIDTLIENLEDTASELEQSDSQIVEVGKKLLEVQAILLY